MGCGFASFISAFRAFTYCHFKVMRKEVMPVQIMKTVKPIMKSAGNSSSPKTIMTMPTTKPKKDILL